jgi:hypothetical protein
LSLHSAFLSASRSPGFQVATEDLDQYKTSKVLSAYEITGKQLMLYLSALPASGLQSFKYRLQATMPVTASDGGTEVYLYYQPKQRSTSPVWSRTTASLVVEGGNATPRHQARSELVEGNLAIGSFGPVTPKSTFL